MARYNPFFERAGMRKVAEQPPPKEALKVAEILSSLGFNVRLLCSGKYVLGKLRSLSPEQIDAVREAFIKYAHPRFMKSFSWKMPFGSKEAYAEQVMKASPERLTQLIKICGFLMQTKAYLFWQR